MVPSPSPPPTQSPSEPSSEADIGAAIAEFAQNPIITLLIGIVIGLLLGAPIGYYYRKKAKAAGAAPSEKAKAVAAAMSKDAGQGDSSSIKDPDAVEDELLQLVNFLDINANPGIDDHPDLHFNPIIEYQMRQAKDRERKERMEKAAIEAGLTLEELESQGIAIGNQRNALATLVAAGARLEPVHRGDTAAEAHKKEARRKVKNIETYLIKQALTQAQDSAATAAAAKRMAEKARNAKKVVTVYDKAMDTVVNRHGGTRGDKVVVSAKAARNQLRDFLRRNPRFLAHLNIEFDDDDGRQTQAELIKKNRKNADPNMSLEDMRKQSFFIAGDGNPTLAGEDEEAEANLEA